MKNIIYFFVALFAIVSALTSNMIYMIPAKTLVFMVTVICVIIGIYRREIFINKYVFKLMLLLMLFLLIWGGQGIYCGYNSTVLQHALKVVTLFGTWLLFYILIENSFFSHKQQYKLMVITLVVSLMFKFALEFMYTFDIWSATDINEFINDALSVDMMSLTIFEGYLTRISTITDVLPLSIFPFLYPFLSTRHRLIMSVLIVAFAMINFSRVYILQTFMLLILLYGPSQFRVVKLKNILYGLFLMIIISGFLFMTWNDISEVMYGRFLGDSAEASDYERIIQMNYLLGGIYESPLMGHGLGSYVSECIRSESMPFLYEMEWFALMYQLGIVGCIFLIGLLLMVMKQIRGRNIPKRFEIIIYINIIAYFIRPFANPMLFASNSIMVLVFMLMFCNMYENTRKYKEV